MCLDICSTYKRLQYTRKQIIIVCLFTLILCTFRTQATRISNYRQYGSDHWFKTENRNPDWKVQYNTTLRAPITSTPRHQEAISAVQEHKDEGGGENFSKGRDRSTSLLWEIVVDKSGGRRNVSGIRRSSVSADIGGGVNKNGPGHVGLEIKVEDEHENTSKHNDSETARFTSEYDEFEEDFSDIDAALSEALDVKDDDTEERKRKKKKFFKKMLLPLLLAYKLKFMALIPLLIAALVLLAGSTGMAGFFFALFAAAVTHNKEE